VADLTEVTAADDVEHPGGQRVVAPVESLHDNPVALSRGLGDFLGFPPRWP